MGAGLIGDSYGFTVQGQVSFMLSKEGFFEDVSNQVHLEFSIGPTFGFTNATPIQYSAHARWDFLYDRTWTFFAIGGLAGSAGGGSFKLFPRFGLGAFYRFTEFLWLRSEISHEQILFGLTVPF